MPKRSEERDGKRPFAVNTVLASACAMAALWILLVGSDHRDEMIVGAAGVAFSTFLLGLIASVQRRQERYMLTDLLQIRHVPLEIVRDIGVLLRILWKDLLLGAAPAPVFRFCGFQTSKTAPEDVARRVLVTAYSSAAPNTIVLGIDYNQSRMLFHQLERSAVSKTMRSLGARG